MNKIVLIALIVGIAAVASGITAILLLTPGMPPGVTPSAALPVYPGASFNEKKTKNLEKNLEMSFIKDCKAMVYSTFDEPSNVASFYKTEMEKRGWELYQKIHIPTPGPSESSPYGFLFKKGDQGAAIVISIPLMGEKETFIGIVTGPWESVLPTLSVILASIMSS
jgi:hypothetical protein